MVKEGVAQGHAHHFTYCALPHCLGLKQRLLLKWLDPVRLQQHCAPEQKTSVSQVVQSRSPMFCKCTDNILGSSDSAPATY